MYRLEVVQTWSVEHYEHSSVADVARSKVAGSVVPHSDYKGPPPTNSPNKISLAATHPAMYRKPAKPVAAYTFKYPSTVTSTFQRPKLLCKGISDKQISASCDERSQMRSKTMSAQAQVTPPWRLYVDPMRQTHWRGERDMSCQKGMFFTADTAITIGHVTSPTSVIGLPFGNTTETAARYEDTRI